MVCRGGLTGGPRVLTGCWESERRIVTLLEQATRPRTSPAESSADAIVPVWPERRSRHRLRARTLHGAV